MFHPKVFFGQIWSQKLKFSKLTEIWYKCTLLYPIWNLMFIFSKFLSFIFFWANLVPKSLNQLKFATEVHCYMLVRILTFIFSIFFSFIFLGQIWSRNLKYFKLTEITYRGTLLCAYCNFNVYFFKTFVIYNFFG